MKKIIWTALAILPLLGCNTIDVPKLLQFAKYGIEADCAIGTDALAQNICTFGTDALDAAMAVVNKDPQGGVVAAKQILVDAAAQQPKLKPYLAFLMVKM